MSKKKKHHKGRSGQDFRGTVNSKEENFRGDVSQKEADQEDKEENAWDLQKAALLSALDMETRREIGQEEFDEDAADYENDDNDN